MLALSREASIPSEFHRTELTPQDMTAPRPGGTKWQTVDSHGLIPI